MKCGPFCLLDLFSFTDRICNLLGFFMHYWFYGKAIPTFCASSECTGFIKPNHLFTTRPS